MKRRIAVRAPSNIALIKYMGKMDTAQNLPENGSLSMTLNRLCTFLELEEGSDQIRFLPEAPPGGSNLIVPQLDKKSLTKLHAHCERVLREIPALLSRRKLSNRAVQPFSVRSANSFPTASGIASSASSYAALTLALSALSAVDLDSFKNVYCEDRSFRRDLAALSRQGSGSSCRSFEGPWVKWEKQNAAQVPTSNLPKMAHFVALISSEEKSVSSSQAHLRVKTSPLWSGRPERADDRLRGLESAMVIGDLKKISQLAWSESWEMHSLFHTASEPFSYWKAGSIAGLQFLAPYLSDPVPPIVTMDAGPNIHVIVPETKRDFWREILKKQFPSLLEDSEGQGAEIL